MHIYIDRVKVKMKIRDYDDARRLCDYIAYLLKQQVIWEEICYKNSGYYFRVRTVKNEITYRDTLYVNGKAVSTEEHNINSPAELFVKLPELLDLYAREYKRNEFL